MIDIDKLARESGASLEKMHNGMYGLEWWRFSPDELQLFSEKVTQAAQAAERDRTTAILLKHLQNPFAKWEDAVKAAMEEINDL
jgi:hypothetical protein